MDTLFVPDRCSALLPCTPSGVSMHLVAVADGFCGNFSVYASIHFSVVGIFVLTKCYFI
jgi:hypothetical protein